MRLYNLAEVRYFLERIDERLVGPVISHENWQHAKEELENRFYNSECIENIRKMISDFEKSNPASKYRTDLDEFIWESQFEDFYEDDRETVFVSTIHKSKGREFDSVYLLLNNVSPREDADYRKIYVGITRAKTNLYIHCNTGIFDNYAIPGVEWSSDPVQYPEPEEITMQLTHRDVFLGFFKGKKRLVYQMQSGMELSYQNGNFYRRSGEKELLMVKLSKACAEEIRRLTEHGYSPVGAKVRFVVEWKGKEETEETPIILPDILLRKTEKKE